MRKIPIHQTIVLTEGSVVRPVEQQITVPDIIATLRNTYGTSTKLATEIEGAIPAFDELDRQLQEMGVF